jgi:hypothetical protein
MLAAPPVRGRAVQLRHKSNTSFHLAINYAFRVVRHTRAKATVFIINSSTAFLSLGENVMGNSLHNKIHLGRTSVLSSRRVQAAMLAAVFVTIGVVWLAMRAL